MVVRGPKKVAKTESVAQSDDLINIWKDRKDPEIGDINDYPLWLLEYMLPLEPMLVHTVAYTTADKPFVSSRAELVSTSKSCAQHDTQHLA